jgi:hypothetical protein
LIDLPPELAKSLLADWGPLLMTLLLGGTAIWAASKSTDDDTVVPLLVAGGAGILAMFILYSKGKASRQELDAELIRKFADPIQLDQYRRLLDDETILEQIREAS